MVEGDGGLPTVTPDDDNWKAFASVCIAAMFILLLDEKRTFTVTRERIDDIRLAMAHKMIALGVMGPDEDGNLTFSTLLDDPNNKPN